MDQESSPTPSSISTTDMKPNTLKVDWSWKKFRCLVTDPSPNSSNSMIVHCNLFKPHLEFRSHDDTTPIGTGNLHTFKIDSEASVRGVPMHIKPLRRFVTAYTHPSEIYRTPSGERMNMTWTSSTNFVKWDFICSDENGEAVARFSSNVWAVRKLGFVEFMGERAEDPRAREELTIIGLTIYYTMLLRMNNIFQLFGAIAAKPGYPKGEKGEEGIEMGTPEAVASGADLDLDSKGAYARVRNEASSSDVKPM